MSELTQCNFCSFKAVQRSARARGLKITKVPNMGGVDILLHPKDVDPKTLSKGEPNSKRLREKYFVAWYMELPDHCCC